MEEGNKNILQYDGDKGDDHYHVLGCDELSSKEQIIAEYRSRVLSCHPDKHPGDKAKAKEFEMLQTARDILTDDEKRKSYDKWRHAGMAIPFKTWAGMRDTVHTSMHWASPKKEYMLEERGEERSQNCTSSTQYVKMQNSHPSLDLNYKRPGADQSEKNVPWSRETGSEMLRKFRNYEI